MKYATSVGYDAGGKYLEVYTDEDDASGYGDNARVGRWYGPDCATVDPSTVPLYPITASDGPDPFDVACERRND